MTEKCIIFAAKNIGFLGRVARQRSAKPFTAVRIRQKPQNRVEKEQSLFLPFFVINKAVTP